MGCIDIHIGVTYTCPHTPHLKTIDSIEAPKLVVEGGKKSSKLAARIHIVMNDGNSILCVWQRPTLITYLMGLIKHCKGGKINAQYVKTTFY